jgi:hypothetical protein
MCFAIEEKPVIEVRENRNIRVSYRGGDCDGKTMTLCAASMPLNVAIAHLADLRRAIDQAMIAGMNPDTTVIPFESAGRPHAAT